MIRFIINFLRLYRFIDKRFQNRTFWGTGHSGN